MAAVALAGSGIAVLAVPALSAADVTCQYSGAEPPTLEVFMTQGHASTVVRNGLNLQVESGGGPVVCANGPATVNNTDVVVMVDQSDPVFSTQGAIDLAGGAFAPGADAEPGSSEEIEFAFQSVEFVSFEGTAAVENFRFGTSGANLNAGADGTIFSGLDADVLDFSGTDRVSVIAGESADIIGGQGGAATGSPFPIRLNLNGGGGGDKLTGGAGGDTLGTASEPGDDTLAGGAGIDRLEASDGNESVDGGPDDDRVRYQNAPTGVSVDLAIAGQQNTGGGGLDTITAVENVTGSVFANDTLSGDAGPNDLNGEGGDDTLDGRGGVDTLVGDTFSAGADTLLMRDGGPDTGMCGGGTDTVTADQLGVDTIASDCEILDFAPGPVPPPDGGGGGDASDLSVDGTLVARPRQRALKRGGLVANASCPAEDCAARVVGSIRLPRTAGPRSPARAKRLRLKGARADLIGGQSSKLKLGLRRRGIERLTTALEDRASLKAKLALTVADPAGNQDFATARVTVLP